ADGVPDVNDARIALRHRDVVDAPAHACRADRAEPEAGEQRIVGLIDDRRIARASLALLRGAGRDEQRQDEQRQRSGQAAESMDVKSGHHSADSTSVTDLARNHESTDRTRISIFGGGRESIDPELRAILTIKMKRSYRRCPWRSQKETSSRGRSTCSS